MITKKDKDFIITQHDEILKPDVEELRSDNIISEVINNLDRDDIVDNNLTTIDFNTDLTQSEISSIVPLQMLSTFRVSGKYASLLARTIKRHKVSLNRKGRSEKVDIIKGEREHENDKKDSIFGKVKGFMSGDNGK